MSTPSPLQQRPFNRHRIARRIVWTITTVTVLTSLAACELSTTPSTANVTFTANISGEFTNTMRGAVSASVTDDYARQTAGTVLAPSGESLSYVSLQANDRAQGITFSARGAPTVGTHRILTPTSSWVAGTYSGAYLRRLSNAMQISLADSGSITFTSVTGTLKGEFVLFASKYDVLSIPPLGSGSGTLAPTSRGVSVIRIAGTFNALLR